MVEQTAPRSNAEDRILTEGIPTRVGQLESMVDTLHQDSVRTQGAISGLVTQVSSLTDTMKDLAVKLDQTRTRRPDMGALASWAAVLLVIMGMTYAPLALRMSQHEETLKVNAATNREQDKMVGSYVTERQYIREELESLRSQTFQMRGDRFTKQDGQRLEQKIDELAKDVYGK